MATKCEYCETACVETFVNEWMRDQISSYGQKTTESVKPPMLCSRICAMAMNKRGLLRNLREHLVELYGIGIGLGPDHPFMCVFVTKTIRFYQSEITRKVYLESVSETIELVNALQDEELLQIVCHTQAWAISLESKLKKFKVKFQF